MTKDQIPAADPSEDDFLKKAVRFFQFFSTAQKTAQKVAEEVVRAALTGDLQRRRILHVADNAIELGEFDNRTRELIAHSRSEFSSNMQIIIDAAATPNGEQDPVRQAAVKAVYAAFSIGIFAENPKEVARELIDADDEGVKKHIDHRKGKALRDKRQPKTELKDALLAEAIAKVEPNTNRLANSDDYAEKIRPDVIKNFNELFMRLDERKQQILQQNPTEKGWPKKGKIRKAIEVLKKAKSARNGPT